MTRSAEFNKIYKECRSKNIPEAISGAIAIAMTEKSNNDKSVDDYINKYRELGYLD